MNLGGLFDSLNNKKSNVLGNNSTLFITGLLFLIIFGFGYGFNSPGGFGSPTPYAPGSVVYNEAGEYIYDRDKSSKKKRHKHHRHNHDDHDNFKDENNYAPKPETFDSEPIIPNMMGPEEML